MKKYIGLIGSLLLAGCSLLGTEPRDNDDLLARLATITQEDLDAAIVDAQSHNDILALACYQTLKPTLAALRDQAKFESKGSISRYQRARDLRRGVEGGIPDNVRLGCGGLLIDQRDFILRLGLMAR